MFHVTVRNLDLKKCKNSLKLKTYIFFIGRFYKMQFKFDPKDKTERQKQKKLIILTLYSIKQNAQVKFNTHISKSFLTI